MNYYRVINQSYVLDYMCGVCLSPTDFTAEIPNQMNHQNLCREMLEDYVILVIQGSREHSNQIL